MAGKEQRHVSEMSSPVDPGQPLEAGLRHRQLIVVSGAREWAVQQSKALVDDTALWLGTAGPDEADSLPWHHQTGLRKQLGATLGDVVFDAYGGFDPDLFALVAGAIGGGARLVLLAPLDDWAGGSRFLRRLACKLRDDPQVVRLDAAMSDFSVPPRPAAVMPAPSSSTGFPYGAISADQAEAVARIFRVVEGHRRRPLVLLADRGRGKSSALGLAASELIRRGRDRIVVTAPRRTAVDAVFQRLADVGLDGAVTFLPPDRLLTGDAGAAALFVDEAAAIPLDILRGLLARHARMVFSTTVHGYEGSGRGFVLRFRDVLDQYAPGWHQFELSTPVRWADGDPLERFVFDALLLKAEPAAVGQGTVLADEAWEVLRLDRERLVQDETRLSALFGLLVAAHYRTTPGDLERLLDQPSLEIHVVMRDGAILATVLTVLEGGLDGDLGLEVRLGRRRLRGHLAPQALIAHLGLEQAAGLRCRRVVRIATHPRLRRRGLARALLSTVAERAQLEGIDYLAASFGAPVGLLRFWRANGYLPVRFGVRRNAASGLHSALVMRPVSTIGYDLFDQARWRFAEALPLWLADPLRDLDPAVAVELFHGLADIPDAVPRLSATDLEALREFADSDRSLLATLPALQRLTRVRLAQGRGGPSLENLLMKLLQHRDLATIARYRGWEGKAAALEALRSAVETLLSN